MKWPAYQAFLAMPGRHIGLAPLLDLPFNRGRSYTKFFDITRCGAVGVYSPGSVYSEVVSHGQDGLVVELEQEVWVEAILSLAQDEPLRQRLLRNAEVKSTELTGLAQRGYSGLVVPHTGEEEDSW
jgi:Glycosyl transferases group 1